MILASTLTGLPSLNAQTAPFAVVPARLTLAVEPASLLSARGLPQEREEALNNAGRRAWKRSLLALAASQSLDVASSYGMRELNPLLASSDGRFGAKAASIKFGATTGITLIEYVLVKKYPKSARLFSKLNWSSSALTTGIAVHNFAIR